MLTGVMPVWMKITLRMPLQVHTALTNEAERDGKSLNQIIVDKLNASVGGVYIDEETANAANVIKRLDDLEKRLSLMERRLKKPEQQSQQTRESSADLMLRKTKEFVAKNTKRQKIEQPD